MPKEPNRRYAWISLFAFALAVGSRPLFAPLPSPFATLSWKIFWVLLCFTGIRMAHRIGPARSWSEMGLGRGLCEGGLVALLSSLPMLAVFALTAGMNPQMTLVSTLMTVAVAPFTEELLFRGYLFLQLHRRAQWSFLSSVLVTALAFGLAHLGTLARTGAGPRDILGEMAFIAAGGAFYAWLLIRWNDNLWVAVCLHGFMNLWCEAFGCDQIVGSSTTQIGRALTVLVAVSLTLQPRLRRCLTSHF